ncbi:MAG TPA: 1-acyl-sn-glycerol-3-phosphate acyltransferase, partial [Gemmataceae bacterium]|nr:1-acyl-sn-glycerol-3-phosphate acyltransferase [Gemmataceae bacterium]
MANPSAVLASAALFADWPASDWALHAGAVVLILAVIGLVCWLRPYWPLRAFLWTIAHSIYWVRVIGRRNVPSRGAALLVCNHVSYVDWLLLMATQRRFIRFVVWAGWTKKWGLRHLLRWAGCIPIDGASGPRAIVKSLRAASDALARGEMVCIFGEGGITRTGFLLPFHRGLEQIVKRSPAPIIPVCLDNVWGSVFSFSLGRFFWKWPQKLLYPVHIAFGKPLPATATAMEVRQAIQKLSADCSIVRADERRPVHRQFVRTAVRHPFRVCFIDPNSP